MKMALKLFIVCIICLTIIVLLYILGLLIYSSFTAFKPEPIETLKTGQKGDGIIPIRKELTLFTWNIGYAGLGKEMDFFYEGGKMVRPSKILYKKYILEITDFIAQQDSIDFFIFQEVDFNSKRSYYDYQMEKISELFTDYSITSAINYKSGFIPVPWHFPMGKVLSGLMTASKYRISESLRLDAPGKYSYPKRLFMMHRCVLMTRCKVENKSELVLLNIHNSAYDDADKLRNEELKLIISVALDEYNKGNYVIVGGDWNQNPPGMDLSNAQKYKLKSVRPISNSQFPGDWQWAFDNTLPTNRDVDKPFDIETTTCSIIDFFLISPNIEIIETHTIDIGFENSDHLPVLLKIRLKE
jgi:endonuclease/exonuclease/phosphatase family metal-dependent hydrolase